MDSNRFRRLMCYDIGLSETSMSSIAKAEARLACAPVEDWMRLAVQLDEENRKLRQLLTDLVVWIGQTEDLLAVAQEGINQRWPNDLDA